MGWHRLEGKKFERLLVLEKVSLDIYKEKRWKCICDCGNYSYVRSNQLINRTTRSCGCLKKEINEEAAKKRFKDIAGHRFGKLIALERVLPPITRKQNKRVFWKCLCDCGNHHVVDGGELRNGSTKSCGCLKYKPYGEAAFNALYYSYKSSSNRRKNGNFEFTIEKEKFKELTKKNCYYCGKEPSTIARGDNGEYVYNGLDRVDNNIGYHLENIVPCCSECNFMKGAKKQEDFLNFIKRLIVHWKDKKI